MKIKFENRLEAIEWIASYAEDEKEFESLREQLNYNHIYTGQYFVKSEEGDSKEKEDQDQLLEFH